MGYYPPSSRKRTMKEKGRPAMLRFFLLLALLSVSCLACTPSAVEGPGYEATMLMLPEGRPDAGREAFVALGCASCHAVARDPDLPAPVSASPGPELDASVASLGRGRLATSVIAPSHKVAKKYRAETEGGGTAMGDYSAVMTVQQLADVVAYIERQGHEARAPAGKTSG